MERIPLAIHDFAPFDAEEILGALKECRRLSI